MAVVLLRARRRNQKLEFHSDRRLGAKASPGGHLMNVTAVESTTLAMVAYDDARELLQLEFRSRAIYQYFGVPAAVHTALLRAPSKGSYFNRIMDTSPI